MNTKNSTKNIMNLSEREVAEIVENRPRVIGGYMSLDSRMSPLMPCNDGWLLNSGRNALEFILRSMPEVKSVYIPDYYCGSIEKKLKSMKLKVKKYSVNERLELSTEIIPADDEVMVFVNYFGVKDHYIYEMASKYEEKCIIDNCQAWYATVPCGVKAFYSAPKFFGVPDGGKAVGASLDGALWENLKRSQSYDRCKALLKRIDCGAEAAYEDSKRERSLVGEEKMMKISHLTDSMLRNLAFSEIRQHRLSNFQHLHSVLGSHNPLSAVMDSSMKAPMVYPFLCEDPGLREYLIKNKIFCATYWPEMLELPEDGMSRILAEKIIPLPIDQRYDFNDMQHIIDVIKAYREEKKSACACEAENGDTIENRESIPEPGVAEVSV